MRGVRVSPIHYMGSKYRLLRIGLVDEFPSDISLFVEPFAGSGVVSINTKAEGYILNDTNKQINALWQMFKGYSATQIIAHVEGRQKEYNLPIGKIDAEQGLEGYRALRDLYNKTFNVLDLYTLTFYAFSQQMRFNAVGEFNMPYGNRGWINDNANMVVVGCEWFQRANVAVANKDFKELGWGWLRATDFVYFDPPYINTTAVYNEKRAGGKWGIENDKDLFALCDSLTERGIRWAMSNVFENKGIENTALKAWVADKGYNVRTFDNFKYTACGKGAGNVTLEVLVKNYGKGKA